MKTCVRVLWLLFIAAYCAMAGEQAETVLTDAFSVGTATGQPLNERRVDQGEVTWAAVNNLVVNHEGARGFVSVRTPGAFVARIPVPVKAKLLTMEGDLRSVASGPEAAGWVAIGLGDPSLNPINMNWPAGIFVLLNARGEFECHYNPGGAGAKLQRIKSGKVARFDAKISTSFLLRVDSALLTVDLEVNRVPVLDKYKLANVSSFSPSFAGFSGYGQKPGTDVVSWFSLKTTP